MKLFTIFDVRSESFSPVLGYPARGAALREFVDQTREPQSSIAKHPGDFILFEIGEFDQSTGVLSVHEERANLGSVLQYLTPEEKGDGRD